MPSAAEPNYTRSLVRAEPAPGVGPARLSRPPRDPQVPRLLRERRADARRRRHQPGGDPEDPKTDGELKRVVPLIRDRVKVEPERLADEDIDLRRLVGRRSLMPDVEG